MSTRGEHKSSTRRNGGEKHTDDQVQKLGDLGLESKRLGHVLGSSVEEETAMRERENWKRDIAGQGYLSGRGRT